MKIGIPKALMYYRYNVLWRRFFEELGCEVIESQNTDYKILQSGEEDTMDENCLPVKLYMGHIKTLMDKCDYILVPRFEDFGVNDVMCDRFFGIYDMVKNTYPNAPFIDYNISQTNHKSELSGFLQMGQRLGKNSSASFMAYTKAKREQGASDKKQKDMQNQVLQNKGLKVLIAAQPYLIHDHYVGGPILNCLKELGVTPIFSDYCDRKMCSKLSKNISQDLYWIMNKESIGTIMAYKNLVHGIILLTAYPCGTDALVNEMVMRKVKDKPIIQLMIDGQQGEAGMQTRLESFVDILEERRRLYA